jgi:hypothetical protein
MQTFTHALHHLFQQDLSRSQTIAQFRNEPDERFASLKKSACALRHWRFLMRSLSGETTDV